MGQEIEVRDAAALLGRRGGRSTSAAKAAAARANGSKGGRPGIRKRDVQPGCDCVRPPAAPIKYAPQVETRAMLLGTVPPKGETR